MRLHQVFEANARTHPDRPAIEAPGVHWAWRNIAWRGQRAAARLVHEWSVQAGDRVAYLGANQADCLLLLTACDRIGAVYCPLNVRLAPAELAVILQDARPALLLADPAHLAGALQLAATQGLAVHAIDTLCATPCRQPTPEPAAANLPLLLVYTSGTTGRAKGVLHDSTAMAANVQASVIGQAITEQDVVLSVLPLFHVGGLCIQTLPALASGAQVLLHERFDAGNWLAAVQQQHPSLSLLVPAAMQAIIDHPHWPTTDLTSLRALYAGSSVIPVHLIEAFQSRGVPVPQVYGATETGPTSTVQSIASALAKPGCAGAPASGVQIEIQRDVNATDGIGQILVRGPNLMCGYLNSANSGLDSDGWFATGDLGQLDADGELWVVGRSKDMLISGGENIYPAEIENLLLQIPAVAQAAVVGLPDPRWGEVPVACVVRRAGQTLSHAQVLAFLQDRLARFKQPRRVLFMDALPHNALGKIEKARLRELVSMP
jgi:fatty-acyl-CoA synthase